MRIEQYLVAILLAGLCIVIGLSAWVTHISEYDIDGADEGVFDDVYTRLQSVRNTQKNALEENLIGKDVQDEGAEDFSIAGAYRASQGAYDSIQFAGNISSQIVMEAGLADTNDSTLWPTISRTFMVILGILFLASLMYMVFRFQPR